MLKTCEIESFPTKHEVIQFDHNDDGSIIEPFLTVNYLLYKTLINYAIVDPIF